MDPGTGIALFGAKDIIIKLLGPSADYLGEQGKLLIEKAQNNIKRIFNHSVEVLGEKIETEGMVSPRILKEIINEGAYCDDELTAEYFGGVLASSRSGIIRDDRGLTMMTVIKGLSTYQIRAHYIFYSLIKQLYTGYSGYLGSHEDRLKMGIYISSESLFQAMELDEKDDLDIFVTHIVGGLIRNTLLYDSFAYGNPEALKRWHSEAKEDGLCFIPSSFGFELFMWVHGLSNTPFQNFLEKELEFKISDNVKMPEGAEKSNN